jgi:hypothetical protein
VKFRFGLPGVLAAALVCAGCDLGGNSGSETTNGLAGKVRDPEGRPVAGARVRLLAEDFDPGASAPPLASATDAQGDYAFAGIAPGRYNLELSDSARGRLSLVPDVDVPTAGASHADGMLGEPGGIRARISDFAGSGDTGYLYIPGTGAYVPIGPAEIGAGEADLAPVPAGRFDSLVLVLLTDGARRSALLARDVEIFPGSTAVPPPFRTWAYSRRIPIDTKAMGIGKDVNGFPLLVRLTAADFDFAQAAAHGEDIRFADATERPLPFEMERWDAAAGRAELWVRLDTVRGNDAEQHILMYWGGTGAKGGLPGPAVFAPEAGFAAVYHLDDAANTDTGGYRDATPNGNHATAASINPGAGISGVIGPAKGFAGTPTSSQGTLTAPMPPGFGGNASFTVSFWLQYRMAPLRQGILDFGSYDLQKDVHFLLRPDTTVQFGAYDRNQTGADPAAWQSVFKLPQPLARWTHVATVYDSGKGTLEVYVDGARADSLAVPAMAVDAAGGLRIGQAIVTDFNPPRDTPFNGDLDEVRFENRALSPERIKLDYMTQKP